MNRITLTLVFFFTATGLSAQQGTYTAAPCVTLCNHYEDSLTKEEILSCGKLVLMDTSYRTGTIFMYYKPSYAVAGDAYLNDLMKSRISEMKKGDEIIFEMKLIKRKDGSGKSCMLRIKIK